jgi:ornithine carbamoyltransferase
MTALRTPVVPHVLRVADLDVRQFDALLDLAAAMKRHPLAWHDALKGRAVACYFAKASTRARVSFEVAINRLGGLPVMLRPDELQVGRGEPIADTARVLSSYCSAIVVRTFAQSDVEALAAAASVPVVNALTDEHHPCQALADLLTLRERFGSLAGLRLAYIGDGNNVAHSLLEAGALAGMHVTVASPVGFWPRAEVLERATAFARSSGGSVSVVSDPRDTVGGADAVYTDVWVSMGQDEESERRREELSRFGVDAALMSRAADDAIFLHCLPAHRGQEVTAEVIDGPSSAVWQQAANRLPTEQALLYALVTGDWTGAES